MEKKIKTKIGASARQFQNLIQETRCSTSNVECSFFKDGSSVQISLFVGGKERGYDVNVFFSADELRRIASKVTELEINSLRNSIG